MYIHILLVGDKMKKMSMVIPGMLGAAALMTGAYIMLNKKTRKKAGKVIDSTLDELNSAIKNMEN